MSEGALHLSLAFGNWLRTQAYSHTKSSDVSTPSHDPIYPLQPFSLPPQFDHVHIPPPDLVGPSPETLRPSDSQPN